MSPTPTGAEPTTTRRSASTSRFRRVFGDPSTRGRDDGRRTDRAVGAPSQPFGAGRDPKGLADVIVGVTTELGWNSPSRSPT